MTQLLAINTASASCSVALYKDGDLTLRESQRERQAAQQLLPLIQELLTESGQTLAALDAITVVTGPGSFTGMRIGVGVAQGLGMANALPVLPVSTLAVMARQAADQSGGSPAHWLVAMPARDPEIYLGAYRRADSGAIELLHSEWVGAPQSLAGQLVALQIPQWGLAGTAWKDPQLALDLQLPADCPVLPVEGSMVALCDLALQRWQQQAQVSADQALPNYVKEEMDYS